MYCGYKRKTVKKYVKCVRKAVAACNWGGMGFKWDDDSNPKHCDTPMAGTWPCNCVRKPLFLRSFLRFFTHNSKTKTLLLRWCLVFLKSLSKTEQNEKKNWNRSVKKNFNFFFENFFVFFSGHQSFLVWHHSLKDDVI